MKIMTQNRWHLIDTIGADICIETNDEGLYEVVLEKNKKKHILGIYEKPGVASKELSNIFQYTREKKDCYCMRE